MFIVSGVLFIWAVAPPHSTVWGISDFIAYYNFCYTYHSTYHAKIFWGLKDILHLHHLNDNRAYRAQGRGFWRIGAYRWWHKRTFFDMPSSHGACISPQSPFEHSRCFGDDTKGADGAADLLEVLRNSPLEKLNFEHCSQIPSAAWQKLRGASWTNLKEANFYECLVLQTWLRCLASSLRLHVFFPNVKGHCHGCFFDSIWQHWQAKNVK